MTCTASTYLPLVTPGRIGQVSKIEPGTPNRLATRFTHTVVLDRVRCVPVASVPRSGVPGPTPTPTYTPTSTPTLLPTGKRTHADRPYCDAHGYTGR